VGHQGAFDFGGTHAVTADVDHVVDAAGDPVVAVLVAPAAIAGEVQTGELLEVGLVKPRVVAKDGARLSRPGVLQAEIAAARAVKGHALVVDQHRLDAEKG